MSSDDKHGTPTPITDAAEIDALMLNIPGQQTTDKVVPSYVARQLESELAVANRSVDACLREIDQLRAERDSDLSSTQLQSEAAKAYAAVNPLGGPAKMFDAIADRIRAGEEYYAVLLDYDLQHSRDSRLAKIDALLDELGAPINGEFGGISTKLSRRGRIKALLRTRSATQSPGPERESLK